MRAGFLGIDSSCYTTSLAILDEESRLIVDERSILAVAKQARGLRQSEMVFQHTKNLPILMERLKPVFAAFRITAITVTDQPRAIHDSYMPAFLPGIGLARSLGAVLGVPVYTISHQHNHILAGLWSADIRNIDQLIALQLSGGTTEVIAVRDIFGVRPVIEIIAETSDISAGQFIDRLGVALGLDFPAGAKLEILAATGQIIEKFPVRLYANSVSFSGYDTKFARLAQAGIHSAADIAATAQDVVARTLIKFARQALDSGNSKTLLMIGGVAANQYIIDAMRQQIVVADKNILINVNAKFCPDNAVGAAFYAQLRSLAV